MFEHRVVVQFALTTDTRERQESVIAQPGGDGWKFLTFHVEAIPAGRCMGAGFAFISVWARELRNWI
jgi:hypothetical protein